MQSVTQNQEVYGLSHWLKDQRLRAGLSQEQVAKHLGYSSGQFISNWERGVSKPPTHQVPPLAELLRVPLDDLVTFYIEEVVQDVLTRIGEAV